MTGKKIDFGIFSNEKQKSEKPYISVDSQGRIYMNSDTQKRFGITKSVPTDVQIGHVDGTIYLVRFDSEHADPEKKPFRFSGDRAYASAKTFIEQAGIKPDGEEKKSVKYFLDEDFKDYVGVFSFIHEEKVAAMEAAAAEAEAKAAAVPNPKLNRKQQAEAAAKAKAEAKAN
jgi:hypothetical protein